MLSLSHTALLAKRLASGFHRDGKESKISSLRDGERCKTDRRGEEEERSANLKIICNIVIFIHTLDFLMICCDKLYIFIL